MRVVTSASSSATTYVNGLKLPNKADEIQQYCADFVRFERVRQGMTQGDLAAKAGIRQPSLSRIESGSWQSIKLMMRVYRALGHQFELQFAPKDGDAIPSDNSHS